MKGTVKKEGNSWYYQFTVGYSADGKRKQKKKRGFKTKKEEAQQALTGALNAVNTGTYIEPSTTLYKEYLDDWFTILAFRHQNCIKATFKVESYLDWATIRYQSYQQFKFNRLLII